MPFIPQSDSDRKKLLEAIGVDRFDDLLQGVPENLRLKEPLDLPNSLSELEVVRHLEKLAAANSSLDEMVNFMGAGAYDHFIPAIVPYLTSRPEFQTAYTPYQAEVSQGTLQAIYEYQSLICRLTGMETSNASLYDGASAVAEAVSLAITSTRRRKVLLSRLLHPHYRGVVESYVGDRDTEFVTVADDRGIVALDSLKDHLSESACFVMQNPNFYGIVEPTDEIPDLVHSAGALLISAVNPISLGVMKPPGEYDADICVGEGQPLGNALSFGGPYFGFFAAKKKYVRKLPGRLAAMGEDTEGKRGFCLTLQTREQHIRRDKATSNICTNQALCALAGTIYMVTMGKAGIRDVASLCLNKAHYLQEQLCSLENVEMAYDRDFFMEFALKFGIPARQVFDRLAEKQVFAGVPTSRFLWDDDYLITCATEKRTREEMDYYQKSLKEVIS